MPKIGEILRMLREEKGEPLRRVAAFLDMDQAILSKIERGHRKATRAQIEKLAGYFETDKKELLVAWLSDRIVDEVKDEEWGEEALKVAEEQIHYLKAPKINMAQIKKAVKEELDKYKPVKKAWVFGSFARDENDSKSDIDVMIDVPSGKDFSLFDMFEIQHNLENTLHRKVDIVMRDAVKPFAWKTAKEDLKLIYDRS